MTNRRGFVRLFAVLVPPLALAVSSCGGSDGPTGLVEQVLSHPTILWSQVLWDNSSRSDRLVLDEGSDPPRVLGTGRGPFWSPDGGQIVFECLEGLDAQCISNADGSDRHVLFQPGADVVDWSASNSSLLYVRSGLLYKNSATGNDEAFLATPEAVGIARWAPDGLRLSYVSRNAAGFESIFTMASDGTDQVEVFSGTDSLLAKHVEWSPEGDRLLVEVFAPDERQTRHYLMNQLGSNITTVHEGQTFDARFSPDGSRIAFATDTSGVRRIAVVSRDLSQFQFITNGTSSGGPVWSPDSGWLAFVRADPPAAVPRLYVVRSDGSGLRSLFIEQGHERVYAWRP